MISEKSYLGEVPGENAVVVFRDSDFNVGHVAVRKYEKHRPLQRTCNNKHTQTHTHSYKKWVLAWPHAVTCTRELDKQKVLRGQLQSGPVLLLRLPWVCECNTVEVVFESTSGEQSAPFLPVPLLIHHLADCSYSYNNGTVFFSHAPHIFI